MNGAAWVSLVALTGWLVLALGSYRAYRVGGRRTLVMVSAWAAIFLLVTGVFAAVGM